MTGVQTCALPIYIEVESTVGQWTKFKFWVPIELLPPHEIDEIISARPALQLQNLPETNTKTSVAIRRLLQNDNRVHGIKVTTNLRIICADDMYLNLEALRVVFSRLGLLQYCDFVSNGQQVIESCIRHYNSKEPGQETVTIVIVDYEMPVMTGLQAVAEVRAFYSQ